MVDLEAGQVLTGEGQAQLELEYQDKEAMEEQHFHQHQQPLRGVEAEALLQLVAMAQAQSEGLVVLAQLPPFLVHPQLMLEVEEVAAGVILSRIRLLLTRLLL
jgi:hypothetical protein